MKKIPHIKIAGFTLIEALIAALIVGVGMLGLAKLQGELFISNSESRMRTHASNLAQDKIEEFRKVANQNLYAGFANGNDTVALAAGSANTNFNRSWTVTTYTNPPYKQISVTVVWTDSKGINQNVQLTSDVAAGEAVKTGILLASQSTTTTSSTITTATSTTTTVTPTTTTTAPTTTTTTSTTTSLPSTTTTTTTVRIGGAAPDTHWTGINPKTITWAAITGAIQYKVYSCTTSNNNSLTSCVPTTLVAAIDLTSYAPGDPGSKNTRCIQVIASDGFSDSAASNVMCIYQKNGSYSYTP